MLNVFKAQFEELEGFKEPKRTKLLANLMTRLESHYTIPMNKARFEKEVEPEVRELYLAISNARSL